MYAVGWSSFVQFTNKQGYGSNFPPTLKQLTDFIAYSSIMGYSPNTIKSYVSAISYKCKMANVDDFSECFVVKKMLQGLSRLDVRKDLRMPILLSDLSKIIHALPVVCYSAFEATLFSAIFSLAFFGFFRVGELVQITKFESGHALQRHNIKYCASINALEVTIPHSKTDQKGHGATLCIPASEKIVCPVQAFKCYESVRPPFLGTYFRHLCGSPVTRYQFTTVLKKALSHIGVENSFYSSH